jgi:hypothetical protein
MERYQSGAGDQVKNAATLHSAIEPALLIGVGIAQMLRDQNSHAEFGQLVNRFQSMPAVLAV